MARGDSAELQAKLRHFMHLMRAASADPQGRDAFSGQGRVLKLLSLQDGVAQKDLAAVLGIRSQSLAELLSKMEAKGLVSRAPNPRDKRTSIVSLTDEGKAAAKAQNTAEEFDPFGALSDKERGSLAGILDTLISAAESHMSPEDFPPTPLKWPPPPPPGDAWGPPPPPRGRPPGPPPDRLR